MPLSPVSPPPTIGSAPDPTPRPADGYLWGQFLALCELASWWPRIDGKPVHRGSSGAPLRDVEKVRAGTLPLTPIIWARCRDTFTSRIPIGPGVEPPPARALKRRWLYERMRDVEARIERIPVTGALSLPPELREELEMNMVIGFYHLQHDAYEAFPARAGWPMWWRTA